MTVLGKCTIANCTAIFKQLKCFAASVCGPWHGNILHWRCENTGSTTALWYGHVCFKQTRWHLCKNNEDSIHNSATSASSSDQFDVIHCAGTYHVQGVWCYLKRQNESSQTISLNGELFLCFIFVTVWFFKFCTIPSIEEEVKEKKWVIFMACSVTSSATSPRFTAEIVVMYGHCLMTLPLIIDRTLKWLWLLLILMQKSFWWWQHSIQHNSSLHPPSETSVPLWRQLGVKQV